MPRSRVKYMQQNEVSNPPLYANTTFFFMFSGKGERLKVFSLVRKIFLPSFIPEKNRSPFTFILSPQKNQLSPCPILFLMAFSIRSSKVALCVIFFILSSYSFIFSAGSKSIAVHMQFLRSLLVKYIVVNTTFTALPKIFVLC